MEIIRPLRAQGRILIENVEKLKIELEIFPFNSVAQIAKDLAKRNMLY